jgi:hypothetical protein
LAGVDFAAISAFFVLGFAVDVWATAIALRSKHAITVLLVTI